MATRNCPYCGRPIDPAQARCVSCGNNVDAVAEVAATGTDADEEFRPRLIDLGKVDNAWGGDGKFCQLNCPTIHDFVEENIPTERVAAWHEAALQWASRLRAEFGGDYAVYYSSGTVMLSPLPEPAASRLVHLVDEAVHHIHERLGDLAWRDFPGPRVVLLLADQDDYLAYTSEFYSGDSIPPSSGVYLHSGYPHMAVWLRSQVEAPDIITHELTHNCLAHLPLPLWLNEGVAMVLERRISGEMTAAESCKQPLMWDELADAHFDYWNEEYIQAFWAGATFAGDAQELSYSLAEVLVHLLGEQRDDFLNFLARAHYADAGQTAALDCLGRCLGDVAGTFLGEGNWRPVRAKMVHYWEPEEPDSGT